jgi:hypothetical protein
LEEKYVDRKVYQGLKSAYFFDKETFGTDRLVIGGPAPFGRQSAVSWPEFLAKTPLSESVQKDIVRVQEAKVDYLPGLSSDQKKDKLTHELQGVPLEAGQSRSGSGSFLPDTNARIVRRGD